MEEELNDLMAPCIVCGTVPRTSGAYGGQTIGLDGRVGYTNVPYAATMFSTHGHYGSTFWDSFEGELVHVVICDKCLEKNIRRLRFSKVVKTYPDLRQFFFPEYMKELLEGDADVEKDSESILPEWARYMKKLDPDAARILYENLGELYSKE